jgi:hypothetical protein
MFSVVISRTGFPTKESLGVCWTLRQQLANYGHTEKQNLDFLYHRNTTFSVLHGIILAWLILVYIRN